MRFITSWVSHEVHNLGSAIYQLSSHAKLVPWTRKVDVRLPGKGNSDLHGARPVHPIITMIKRIRTSRLSIKNSLSSDAHPGSRMRFITFDLTDVNLAAMSSYRGTSLIRNRPPP